MTDMCGGRGSADGAATPPTFSYFISLMLVNGGVLMRDASEDRMISDQVLTAEKINDVVINIE